MVEDEIIAERKRQILEAKKIEGKKTILTSVEGKIRTVMVRAVALIEEFKNDGIISEEEFNAARNDILDHANKRIRNFNRELAAYDIIYKGHTIKFEVGKFTRGAFLGGNK